MRRFPYKTLVFSCLIACFPTPVLAHTISGSTVNPGASATHHTAAIPLGLRPALYRVLSEDSEASYSFDANGCATLPKAQLTACFTKSGARFKGPGSLALHLVSYGRGQLLSPVQPVRPETNANRVSYGHGNLIEWWRVLPVGFEQGFTITKRPAGQGRLTLVLATSGNPAQHNGILSWGKFHYGNLVVTDAKGRVIPAALKTKGNRVLIAVNDAHAAYPLTVDPLVWLEQKVTASDGNNGAHFGFRVEIQGTTAMIAAYEAMVNGNATQGAVYVFNESAGKWTQTQKLTAEDGQQGAHFGQAIALDGTTALIGAPLAKVGDNVNQGEAYFFTESDGTWTQAQAVIADDGIEYGTFGFGAAIAGNVAFIGAGGSLVSGTGCIPGSAYVFTKSDGTWVQTQKLLSPNPPDGSICDEFGIGDVIGISETTAAVGAYAATVNGNVAQGDVVVYTESDGTWSQTQILTGSDSTAVNLFGGGVAIQGDTILVGAEYAMNKQGEAYVFTKSGGSWAQTQQLTATDGAVNDDFGSFVALDGPRALIGAVGYNDDVGKAYLFTKSNGTWSQTQGFTPSDNPNNAFFGIAGALSGTTLLIGANGATTVNGIAGAAYFYNGGDLGLAVSAPQTVGQGQQYTSQTIATNSSSTASPAVSATISVPAAASFVAAAASQGSCSEAAGVVTCDFGQIPGNAGMATASVTLKATGSAGTTIKNTASVALATPALTASAPTGITSPAACPAGYTEFSGHLDAGETFTSDPITVSEAGQKYVDLTSPASFGFFAIVTSSYGTHTYVYPHAKQGHRWGAAGSYQVGVQAGSGAGGDYTLCVNLNPAQ